MPAGNEVVVIRNAGGSGFTVRDSALVAVPPPLSANFTVKFAAPAADGVPLMAPVDAVSVRPAGKVPTERLQVTGGTAPDCARVAE